MNHAPPSALVIQHGERVLLRIDGVRYDLSQRELRNVLDLPDGSPGLGITIEKERFCFEFADAQVVEITAKRLKRRLTELAMTNA